MNLMSPKGTPVQNNEDGADEPEGEEEEDGDDIEDDDYDDHDEAANISRQLPSSIHATSSSNINPPNHRLLQRQSLHRVTPTVMQRGNHAQSSTESGTTGLTGIHKATGTGQAGQAAEVTYNKRTVGSSPGGEGVLEVYLSNLVASMDMLPVAVQDHLTNLYFQSANAKWPFLLRSEVEGWIRSTRTPGSDGHSDEHYKRFFSNMASALAYNARWLLRGCKIFSISILLNPKLSLGSTQLSQFFHDRALANFTSFGVAQGSLVRSVQAHVMLAIHALFCPSSDQIFQKVSSALRFCVFAKFHLAETEPQPVDSHARVEIQMRRRLFWVSYSLDRLVCGLFGLPLSVPDNAITVPMFEGLEDSSIAEKRPPSQNVIHRTSISLAIHRLRCFQIQSEIIAMTTGPDSARNPESMSEWRSSMMGKLDQWKSQLQHLSEPNSPGSGNVPSRWLSIVYNHCLLYLHRPNTHNVRGPHGEWSVRIGIQSALIFRKFQADQTMAHRWMGLISQFSIAITILYCFWATPPRFRTESYNIQKAILGIQACSNILAVMADRWESARDLRDVFEALAGETPLVEPASLNQQVISGRAIKMISAEAASKIRSKMPSVKSMVINRQILSMIEEMINDALPEDDELDTNTISTGRESDDMSQHNRLAFSQPEPVAALHYPDPAAWRYSLLDNSHDTAMLEFPGEISNLGGYDLFDVL
ncbi:hypothetical protein A1O3_00184 [Capronia epimyces CBS 606.96]|uniref:Xylanolytic transcriptional activator regulatory domain-containing protein n=1 Tax=Capronia epimyces CBS 606.96 TaxID=1182542 RepID=W9ZAT3_9EURO|nr:uncharacterized protein A1O3_00184 [Capronia epimyces CBS 606.96]EXJ91634.1 hypothetical protein A1O3_00184 [Capronia epimyces CBS 606.96]